MVQRSLWIPVVMGMAVLTSGIPLAQAAGNRDRDSSRDGERHRQEDRNRSSSSSGSSGSSAGRLLGSSSSSRATSSGSSVSVSRPAYGGGNSDGGRFNRNSSGGQRDASPRSGYSGNDRFGSGERMRPYSPLASPSYSPPTASGVPNGVQTRIESETRGNRNGDGYRSRYQSDPNRASQSDTPRLRVPRPQIYGSGPSGPSGVTLGPPRDRDSRHADGVTEVGRVLGTTAPVDRYGHTEVGRALRSRDIPTVTADGSRLGTTPNRPYRFHHEPNFSYNPSNGRYERFHDGRGSGFHIGVLLGTGALRPSYRFHVGRSYGTYYYPYYCDNSVSVGFSTFPSLYYYYGYVPLYVPSTRVIVLDNPVVIHRETYVEDNGYDDTDSYYLNRGSVEQDLDSALGDIRRAWMEGDVDLLLRHVRSEDEINVFLKGKYVYSLPPDDYRDLTLDAMKNSTSTGFRWLNVDRRSDDEVAARAQHTFTDSDGEERTVFANFTLTRIHGAWWIAEVGSSNHQDD